MVTVRQKESEGAALWYLAVQAILDAHAEHWNGGGWEQAGILIQQIPMIGRVPLVGSTGYVSVSIREGEVFLKEEGKKRVLLSIRVVRVIPEKSCLPTTRGKYQCDSKKQMNKTRTKHTLEAQRDEPEIPGFSALFKLDSNIFQRPVWVQVREDLALGCYSVACGPDATFGDCPTAYSDHISELCTSYAGCWPINKTIKIT